MFEIDFMQYLSIPKVACIFISINLYIFLTIVLFF